MKDSNDRDPETYAIISATFEAQRTLGTGFLEPVYQEALAIELAERDIVFRRECELGIEYQGCPWAVVIAPALSAFAA
ncbi:GxxExxY protein [Salinisphaera sp. SPP-AMP-43]|uniref:GxxExxY protein n=1 Tax=Salinisphaera sp. SPP-AMP-43 TaxID=3121288 RepID=UPI003C6E178A